MYKKNKIYIKKQLKKIIKKKKFKFNLNLNLEYIKIYKILNKNPILVFFQFISLNSEKNWKYYLALNDKEILNIYMNKKIIKKFFEKKLLRYIKNFNNFLCINNLNIIKNLEKNILILGYYLYNIFFFKEDLKIKNIKKEEIYKQVYKLKNLIKRIILKINLLLKYKIKKFILLLKKK